MPLSKIVTGIPFYARAGWGEEWLFYKDIIKMNPELSFDIDFISYEKITRGIIYNGISTVTKKILENKNLPWDDVLATCWGYAINEYSLLKAINNEMGLNSRETMAQ